MARDGRYDLGKLSGAGARGGYTLVWDGVRWKPASAGVTVQEEGNALTARSVLNFIGGAVTASDNSGSSRTDITIDAPRSTVDIVLPGFSGRSAGDFSYVTTDQKEYVLTGAPATGGLAVSDNFDAGISGNVLSGIWTARLGTMRYSVGTAIGVSPSGSAPYALYTMSASSADGQVSCTSLTAGGSGVLGCRYVDTINYYYADFVNKQLYKMVGAAQTLLATWTATPGVGGAQALSFVGSTLTVYVGTVPVATVTDSSISSTNHGVGAVGNGDGVDNFVYGVAQGTFAWQPVMPTSTAIDADAQTLSWMTVGS